MGKYKVGDRVIATKGVKNGQIGTVKMDSDWLYIDVLFDGEANNTSKHRNNIKLYEGDVVQPDYDETGLSLGGLGAPLSEQARPGDEGSAKKLDLCKAPIKQGFDRYFPNAVFAVAMVSEYGHRKYEPGDIYSGNCLNLPYGYVRYGDAERRHGVKEDIEGPYDDGDSGLPHLAQKAWNAMMELERAIRDGRIEVRRGNDIVDGKPVLGTARAVKL